MAATRVQTSLFGRLRRARGSAVAGRLAWMLVRAGQEGHPDSRTACEALQGVGDADVRAFLIAAQGARDTLTDADAGALAAGVVGALEVEGARRGW